jgi:hypothetical protein
MVKIESVSRKLAALQRIILAESSDEIGSASAQQSLKDQAATVLPNLLLNQASSN